MNMSDFKRDGRTNVLLKKEKASEMSPEIFVMFLLVALGGAVGAVLRYAVGTVVYNPGGIPWNTFIVNFAGCFLICLLFFSMGAVPGGLKAFLFVGVFGAFTTMSSLTLETVELYTAGMLGMAAVNYLVNTAICLVGGFAGRWIALALV
ncbi:MAG: CrcB family protein [Candidatus Methanomethylophilaceae archaeon]